MKHSLWRLAVAGGGTRGMAAGHAQRRPGLSLPGAADPVHRPDHRRGKPRKRTAARSRARRSPSCRRPSPRRQRAPTRRSPPPARARARSIPTPRSSATATPAHARGRAASARRRAWPTCRRNTTTASPSVRAASATTSITLDRVAEMKVGDRAQGRRHRRHQARAGQAVAVSGLTRSRRQLYRALPGASTCWPPWWPWSRPRRHGAVCQLGLEDGLGCRAARWRAPACSIVSPTRRRCAKRCWRWRATSSPPGASRPR